MFHLMHFGKFPSQLPSFCVTVALDNFEGVIEKAKVTLRLEEEHSGHVLCSVGAELNSSVPFTRSMIAEMPLRVPRCHVTSPGNYKFVVLVNNEKVGERTLPILPVTTGPKTDIKED